MKNKIFLGIVLLTILFTSSCKTTREAPQVQQKKEELTVWKQSLFPNIKTSDPVLFFNSTEILLKGSFFNKSTSIEDGKVIVVDSIDNVLKTVPQFTTGGFIQERRPSGVIQIMVVSFSKNEATYVFSFFKQADGSFLLNGKAKLVYQKKEYEVIASTSENCILLFNFEKKEVVNEIKESAEGWRIER